MNKQMQISYRYHIHICIYKLAVNSKIDFISRHERPMASCCCLRIDFKKGRLEHCLVFAGKVGASMQLAVNCMLVVADCWLQFLSQACSYVSVEEHSHSG